MSKNPHTGSSFDDFLKEEGLHEECTTVALKRVLAWQFKQEMKNNHLTKSAMAERMHTSRAQLDRLLNPEKTGTSLETLQRAAMAVGRELRIELV
jgi:predicted XRE-type DNA-binding protein